MKNSRSVTPGAPSPNDRPTQRMRQGRGGGRRSKKHEKRSGGTEVRASGTQADPNIVSKNPYARLMAQTVEGSSAEFLLSSEDKKLIEEGQVSGVGTVSKGGRHMVFGTSVAGKVGLGPDAAELETYLEVQEGDRKMPAVEKKATDGQEERVEVEAQSAAGVLNLGTTTTRTTAVAAEDPSWEAYKEEMARGTRAQNEARKKKLADQAAEKNRATAQEVRVTEKDAAEGVPRTVQQKTVYKAEQASGVAREYYQAKEKNESKDAAVEAAKVDQLKAAATASAAQKMGRTAEAEDLSWDAYKEDMARVARVHNEAREKKLVDQAAQTKAAAQAMVKEVPAKSVEEGKAKSTKWSERELGWEGNQSEAVRVAREYHQAKEKKVREEAAAAAANGEQLQVAAVASRTQEMVEDEEDEDFVDAWDGSPMSPPRI